MTIRCWRIMGWLMVASGVALVAPALGGPSDSTGAEVRPVVSPDSDGAGQGRDPFWPVGYSPVTKTVSVAGAAATSATAPDPVADDQVQRALAMIRVGGVIRRGVKYFAAVNGVMVEAGEAIPIMVDERVVVFTVRSIDMHHIRIEPAQKTGGTRRGD